MESKRLFDLGLAVAGAILASPLLVAIAAGILIGDGRPLMFRQERLGLNKRPFHIIKFRTMRDGRVTAMGHWLRETGLDELPQVINVLKGEMSLVGPRPLTMADVERLGWNRIVAGFRWQVLPGITGLAQLYGQGAADAMCRDLQYVQSRTLGLDAKIVALSGLVNLVGKRRVRRWLRPTCTGAAPRLGRARS